MPFTANPEREALYDDTAELLRRGYTLLSSDVADMLPYFGYSPDSARTYALELMEGWRMYSALAVRGVRLASESYRGKYIYRDVRLGLDETDIDETRRKVDVWWEELLVKRQVVRQG